MNKIIGKINALILSALMIVSGTAAVTGVFNTNRLTAVAADDTIILRVCNWEEYIDTGDWSDDDIIDLESGSIKGENSIITDFENWYYENYGKLRYSTVVLELTRNCTTCLLWVMITM